LLSDDLGAKAELQWRISVPLGLLILTLLAVPLSRSKPRQSRYGGLASGVLIYIIYANLLAAAKVWVEDGEIPVFVGLWSVHAVFLLVAVLMLLWQYGVLGYRFSRRAGQGK
jgi:lipopolysaccharide export system permease protein